MNLYDGLVGWYGRFLSVFPSRWQWVVTLLILIGLIGGLMMLLRRGWIALILILIFLPLWVPVLQHFLVDLYHFGLYLIHSLQTTSPH